MGTKKGEIIKAISVDNLYRWGEIRDALGLTNDSLRPIIKEMKAEGILEEKNSEFRVDYDLWLGYRAHHGDEWAKKKIKTLAEERREKERRFRLAKLRKKEENLLKNRIKEWIRFKKLKVNPDCTHLYLLGVNLDSLVRDLIPLTKKEILVVNPYVEKCAISEGLINASNKGVTITLISQSPYDDYRGKRKQDKIKFHKIIKESPIHLYYNDSVHAKLFILDNQVLTASSMNLYSESTAAKLWEAGIITTDTNNIKRASQSIDQLLKHPETKQQ